MRRIWLVVFPAILAFGAAGYWWLELREQGPTVLSVAAGERGSDAHKLMSELSEVLERRRSPVRLRVQASSSASRSIARLNARKVDLAVIEGNTPAYAGIQIVAELFRDHFLFVVRRRDGGRSRVRELRDVSELPGTRIGVPPPGSVGYSAFWAMVAHYRVPPESFRAIVLPRREAEMAFVRGRVDGLFVLSSLRDPFVLSLVEEAGIRGIRFDFMEIEQAPAMALKRPYLKPASVVRGAFDGAIPLPARDIVVPSLDRVLVANGDVSEDAVAALVQSIDENRLDLLYRMPLSASIADPRMSGSATLALHPGAQRYFDRNEPSFLQENAEPLALIVTVLALLFSAALGLRRQIVNRAKNRADIYNEQLLDIAARSRATAHEDGLRALRAELGEVLETAVHALDRDQVTEDGFRSFSLLLSSVRETLNDRMEELRASARGPGASA